LAAYYVAVSRLAAAARGLLLLEAPKYGHRSPFRAAGFIAACVVLVASGCGQDELADGHDAGGQGGTAGTAGDASAAHADGSAGTVSDGGGCTDPANHSKAKLCLTFKPDLIDFEASEDLDGKGALIVQIFDTSDPSAGPTQQLAEYRSISKERPGNLSVLELPSVEFDNLPEKVYVRTLFVDNPAWFSQTATFAYGMFVGGYDLNEGIEPSPLPPAPLREVRLTKGHGTQLRQPLKVLRKFTARAFLKGGIVPYDDGQGPLRIGAFAQQNPLGAPLFGGAQPGCKDLLAGPVNVTGYIFSLTSENTFPLWFSGQLDDFNTGVLAGPGSILSLDPSLDISSSQKATVGARQYSFVAPTIELNTLLEAPAPETPFSCVTSGDAGADAEPEDAANDTGLEAVHAE
jgi:hypothetical protein